MSLQDIYICSKENVVSSLVINTSDGNYQRYLSGNAKPGLLTGVVSSKGHIECIIISRLWSQNRGGLWRGCPYTIGGALYIILYHMKYQEQWKCHFCFLCN